MAISDHLKKYRDPIWTAREVGIFWEVLQPYLTVLLNEEIPLPDPSIDFTKLNPVSEKDKQRCMEFIHGFMWKGKYSLAVANIKAVRAYFDCGQSVFHPFSIAGELEQLKSVFAKTPIERCHVLGHGTERRRIYNFV